MLNHIKAEKPDLFFWTGDNSPHTIWAESTEKVAQDTIDITEWIKEVLDGEVPVYPTTGNHDVWPVNVEDFSAPYKNEAI
jgi:3',5'-cyclic AMP phosphodiesterase CpdA